VHRLVTLAVVAVLAAATGCGGGGQGGQGGRGGQGGSGGAGLTGFGGFGLTDGGGSTGADGPPLTPAPPICGNGIVEATEACDPGDTTGCALGRPCSATCTCVAGPAAPTNPGALIAQALADGRIDYFTSLLYRAYLLAGDGRLPIEFDGDLTVGEDSALFLEVSALWGSLTTAQQQQLGPYVVRPNDPTSIYSAPPTSMFFGDDDFLAMPGDPPAPCPVLPGGGVDWRYQTSTHFVVWSCGDGNPATLTPPVSDLNAGKRQAVAALAEQVWAKEVPSLGAPRVDIDLTDSGMRTDIYLVPLNVCIRRRDDNALCVPLGSPTTIAAAVPAPPCDTSRGPLTSSGFVLMRLDLVPDAAPAASTPETARSDFAHEFFHLITYGLNLQAQGGDCRDNRFTGPVANKTSWLTEASATWAEWAYTRDDNPDYRLRRFHGYQGRDAKIRSLLDNDLRAADNPSYQAYVYPLFLSQEAGGPMPFEQFWKTVTTARTREQLDDLLNARFPFENHFRDFAAKMLNKTLPGDPLAPLLSTTDSAAMADVVPQKMLPEVALPESDTDIPFRMTIAPLAAQYQKFTVPPGTRWVDVDMTGASADLTMEVIAGVNDRWTRRQRAGLRFAFCRDEPEDDISEFYLVVANTAHRAGARAQPNYKVKTRKSCPGSLTGWIQSKNSLVKHYIDGDETVDQSEGTRETWSLGQQHMINAGLGVQVPGIDMHWTATFAHHESSVRASCQVNTTDGEGSGSHATPFIVTEGGGALTLSPTGMDMGSFDVPMVIQYAMCDGSVYTITDPRTIPESGAAAGYVQLTPMPGRPDRFVGSRVVIDRDTPLNGGNEVIKWEVSWDVTRTRAP